MPELRRDPIVGRRVIIATERARRPNLFRRAEDPPGGLCPYCPGHEDKTPPEVYVSGRHAVPANVPGWKVRVVPNRYPALMIEGSLDREAIGIYDQMNGVGAHEVVIETPEHSRDLSELSDAEVTEVLFAFKARVLDLKVLDRDVFSRYPELASPRTYGQTENGDVLFGRVDYQATPSHRFLLRGNFTNYDGRNGTSNQTSRTESYNGVEGLGTDTWVASWSGTFGSSMINDLNIN